MEPIVLKSMENASRTFSIPTLNSVLNLSQICLRQWRRKGVCEFVISINNTIMHTFVTFADKIYIIGVT